MSRATLVVGLGRTDRGDDGVGPAVARVVVARLAGGADRLEGLNGPDVEVRTEEDPTALIDVWEGHDHVVLVDAVVTGDPAGTLHRIDVGADAPPLPPGSWADTGRAGTHAFGLAMAVELARALGRLPERLVVVGVEAARLDVGTPLTSEVAAAVADAATLVTREVTADVPG